MNDQQTKSMMDGNDVLFNEKASKVAPLLRVVLKNLGQILNPDSNQSALDQIESLASSSDSDLLCRLSDIDDLFYATLPLSSLCQKGSSVQILSTFRKCLTNKLAKLTEEERTKRLESSFEKLLSRFNKEECPPELKDANMSQLAKDWIHTEDVTSSPALQCLRSAILLTIDDADALIKEARQVLLLYRPKALMIDEGATSIPQFIQAVKDRNDSYDNMSNSQKIYYLFSLFKDSNNEEDQDKYSNIKNKIDDFIDEKKQNKGTKGSNFMIDNMVNLVTQIKEMGTGEGESNDMQFEKMMTPIMRFAGQFAAKMGEQGPDTTSFLESTREELTPVYHMIKDDPAALETMQHVKKIIYGKNLPKDFDLDKVFQPPK